MKLIIVAHPDINSFSLEIASTIFKLSGRKADQYILIDLYRSNLKQDYLEFEDVLNIKYLASRKKVQSYINESDEIILIFPIWWGAMPAIMKNFFDTNFLYDYAFTFDENKEIAPLLKWKILSIICTSNSPSSRYEDSLLWYFHKHFDECCGMKIWFFKVIGDMMGKTKKQKNKILKEILLNNHFKHEK